MALIKSIQVIFQYLFKEIFMNKKIHVEKWRQGFLECLVIKVWLKHKSSKGKLLKQKKTFILLVFVWIYSIKNYHHHQSFSKCSNASPSVYSFRIHQWGQCHILQINWIHLISFYMLSPARWIVIFIFIIVWSSSPRTKYWTILEYKYYIYF